MLDRTGDPSSPERVVGVEVETDAKQGLVALATEKEGRTTAVMAIRLTAEKQVY